MKKFFGIIGIISLTLLGWYFIHNKKNPTFKPPQTTAKNKGPVLNNQDKQVPPLYDFNHQFTTIDERPWRDNWEAIEAANHVFDFFLKARDAPDVNTPHDREIWSLIHQYAQHKKPFRYALAPLNGRPTGFVAMYDCGRDVYFIGNNYMTVAELSLAMYHELRHEVDCSVAISRGVKRSDNAYWGSQQCNFEERGYAAGIRYMAALKRLGLLPHEIHGDPRRDNFMDLNVWAWGAIAQGQFCEWFKGLAQYLRDHPEPPPP